MFITELEVKNFKSFEHLNIKLKPFNVLIGANASGKSNFVDIFRFLRDIGTHGLRDAVSLQGGMTYLRNMRADATDNISIRISGTENKQPHFMRAEEGVLDSPAMKFEFSFSLATHGESHEYYVAEERISLKYEISTEGEVNENNGKREAVPIPGTLDLRRNNHGVLSRSFSGSFDKRYRETLATFFGRHEFPPDTLMIESPELFYLGLEYPFQDFETYDFQPKLLKNSTSNKQRVRLAEDGKNFGVALKGIVQHTERRRMFLNLVKSVISFVDDIQVEDYSSDSLQILLKETFPNSSYLPAWLVSDGTMNVAALVAALYFEVGDVKVIEEPERNIHPHLIGRVVGLLEEVSEGRQIIVTTHSAEMVKYAGPESLCLVQRDENGNTIISRPEESDSLKIFLKEDMGLDELYVQNLIGV